MNRKFSKILFALIIIELFMFLFSGIIANAASEKLTIVYFYSDSCSYCKEVKPIIDAIKKDKQISVIEYSIDDPSNLAIQEQYAKYYKIDEAKQHNIPMLFLGSRIFDNNSDIKNNLLWTIELAKKEPSKYQTYIMELDKDMEKSFFKEKAKEITFAGILLAGLLDGINPCAISVLMIFCSFLLFRGKKKTVIPTAIIFIAGSFISNLAIGLGLFTILKTISGSTAIMVSVYVVSIILCIIAVYLNTIDIINGFKKNDITGFKNQLSTETKFKISEIFRKAVSTKFIVLAAFIAGVIIAAMEFSCTGQVYIPTITYMINAELSISYILMLVLYNIMFVLPLILVVLLLLLIKEPEDIKGRVLKYSHIIKIIANIFFMIMIVIMVTKITAII